MNLAGIAVTSPTLSGPRKERDFRGDGKRKRYIRGRLVSSIELSGGLFAGRFPGFHQSSLSVGPVRRIQTYGRRYSRIRRRNEGKKDLAARLSTQVAS